MVLPPVAGEEETEASLGPCSWAQATVVRQEPVMLHSRHQHASPAHTFRLYNCSFNIVTAVFSPVDRSLLEILPMLPSLVFYF